MATYNTLAVVKKLRHRAPRDGQEFEVSGSLVISPGESYALADILNMVTLGENQRPIRVTISALPLSGTPVMTNPTFSVGINPAQAGAFTRPDGTIYNAVGTSATVLAAATALVANTKTVIEVPRPVADSVALYGPFNVSMNPAGAGAFSVAGGTIQLKLEVVTVGETRPNAAVYTVFNSTKVKN